MRCLRKLKSPFYYCSYQGEDSLTDGLYITGEKKAVYSDPILARGHISTAKGSTSVEQFGTELDYDRVIIIDDPDFPIDEHSVLFVDKGPSYDQYGTPAFDYVVKKVSRSFNYLALAISKVKVS